MMAESYNKIDAHSHFGKSYLGPDSSPQNYLQNAKRLNIIGSVISPAPSPEVISDELIFRPCIWKPNSISQVKYISQIENRINNEVIEKDAIKNPYIEANRELIDFVQKNNLIKKHTNLYVMPIYHPILDDSRDFAEILNQREVVAIKIHGIASFTGPETVPSKIIQEIKRRKLPVVAHTDIYIGKINNSFDYARELNNPQKWARWSIETGIPILLTHGARLNTETINLIRNNRNILIGCSPDLAILGEKQHNLSVKTNNFLGTLFKLVNPNQLIFDIDYGWNTKKLGQWSDLDWGMSQRIEASANIARFSEKDLENIYYNNASRFFKLP